MLDGDRRGPSPRARDDARRAARSAASGAAPPGRFSDVEADETFVVLEGRATIADAVEIALAAAEGRNLEVFGADVNRQCIEAGLTDELIIHMVPILLGDGVRLFGEPAADPARLELLESSRSGQITSLRFKVLR